MKSLLLYLAENERFDSVKIRLIFKDIMLPNSLKEDGLIGVIIEGEFRDRDDFTIVRLSDDLETISIDGLGDASLKLALEIQKYYPKPIQVIDSEYNFDISLETRISVGQFRQ
jgi:hypothetical protein